MIVPQAFRSRSEPCGCESGEEREEQQTANRRCICGPCDASYHLGALARPGTLVDGELVAFRSIRSAAGLASAWFARFVAESSSLPPSLVDTPSVEDWIARAHAYAGSLPPKKPQAAKR